MARIIRINGKGGPLVFCGEEYDEDTARATYTEETGEEPVQVSHTHFDMMDARALTDFAQGADWEE